MQLIVDSKQLPVGWKIKYLDKLCENLDSKRVPITKSSRKSGNIPYYGASGIVDYVADYIFDEDLLLVSEDGANLLARTYPIAFSITGKTWVNNHAHVLRFKEKIIQTFIEYYLNSISLEPYVSGMAQPKLNQKSLNSIAIPFPPLLKQKRIVAILDEAFEGIDRAIANTEKNLANSRELFENYLNAIFTQKGDAWVEKKLGDICDFLNGFAFKSNDTVSASDVQLIRMGNLYQNILNLERNPVFYPNDFQEIYAKYVLSEGDLIMSLTGTVDKEDYGYTVEVPKTKKTLLLNQRIAKFVNINSNYVDKKFFLHLLRSKLFLNALYKSSRGVRQANLSSLSMKTISISLPPVEIQKLLVSEFRALEAETQRLEAIYRKKIAVLNELKQSILQKAFTGELTADTPKTVKEELAA